MSPMAAEARQRAAEACAEGNRIVALAYARLARQQARNARLHARWAEEGGGRAQQWARAAEKDRANAAWNHAKAIEAWERAQC